MEERERKKNCYLLLLYKLETFAFRCSACRMLSIRLVKTRNGRSISLVFTSKIKMGERNAEELKIKYMKYWQSSVRSHDSSRIP